MSLLFAYCFVPMVTTFSRVIVVNSVYICKQTPLYHWWRSYGKFWFLPLYYFTLEWNFVFTHIYYLLVRETYILYLYIQYRKNPDWTHRFLLCICCLNIHTNNHFTHKMIVDIKWFAASLLVANKKIPLPKHSPLDPALFCVLLSRR